jgi:hypothetical protein
MNLLLEECFNLYGCYQWGKNDDEKKFMLLKVA